MDWKLSILTFVNYVSAFASKVQHIYKKLSDAFDVVFLPSYYVFFKGIPYPHPLQNVQLWTSASARPELLFNADARVFFPATGETFDEIQQTYGQTCLAYLSLEVIDAEDRVHYDLTDFIENIRVVTIENSVTPSLFHVLAVWSLYSHIVIDPFRFRLRFIDGSGETHTEPIPVPSLPAMKSAEAPAAAETT